MPDDFQYDVFLSHSAKDKAAVRPSHSLSASNGERARVRCRNLHWAKQLRKGGLKVWFNEWVLSREGDSAAPSRRFLPLEDWTGLMSGLLVLGESLSRRRVLALRLGHQPP